MHEVVHEVLGSELTLAEAEKMVEEVDHEHVGKISLQEVGIFEGCSKHTLQPQCINCCTHIQNGAPVATAEMSVPMISCFSWR
jgi:hypothetical protein